MGINIIMFLLFAAIAGLVREYYIDEQSDNN